MICFPFPYPPPPPHLQIFCGSKANDTKTSLCEKYDCYIQHLIHISRLPVVEKMDFPSCTSGNDFPFDIWLEITNTKRERFLKFITNNYFLTEVHAQWESLPNWVKHKLLKLWKGSRSTTANTKEAQTDKLEEDWNGLLLWFLKTY